MNAMMQDIKPWYRQFWPWVLIGLPASAVIASLFTIYIAVKGADTLVVDDYYKQGVAINREFDRERMAQMLGLVAEIEIHGNQVTVRLGSAQPIEEQELNLYLMHPTLAERDRIVNLVPGNDGVFRGTVSDLARGEWQVRLEPMHDAWRLQAPWNNRTQDTLRLAPTIE